MNGSYSRFAAHRTGADGFVSRAHHKLLCQMRARPLTEFVYENTFVFDVSLQSKCFSHFVVASRVVERFGRGGDRMFFKDGQAAESGSLTLLKLVLLLPRSWLNSRWYPEIFLDF